MLYLRIVAPRDCPNCGIPAGLPKTSYECPVCGKEFCANCYVVDVRGSGDYVLCPNSGCGVQLFFVPRNP